MDDRVRGFERAAGHGGVEAQARLLWERVRRGELERERLRLAAHVGDPAARMALAADAPPLPADLRACVRGLEAWGMDALVRAALAAAGRVLHLVPEPAVGWSRGAVEAIAAWLACPCDPHRVELQRLASAPPPFAVNAPAAVLAAVNMAESTSRTAFARHAVAAAEGALDAEARVDDPAGEVALALRDGLVPWALGARDPAARFAAPVAPALWNPPPAPPPLPRLLERTWQGDFSLDRIDGVRWLVLEQEGKRYRVAPFTPRAGERARAFACSLDARVVAWARGTPDGDRVEVRRFADGVFQEWSLAGLGEVVDVAVSPRSQRVAWVATTEGAPDAVWHLDLRTASVDPARLEVEHEVVRSMHFASDAAIGFVTDIEAWTACPREERKGALLERLGVRLAPVP